MAIRCDGHLLTKHEREAACRVEAKACTTRTKLSFQQRRVRALGSAPAWRRRDAEGSRRRASARFVD